MKKHLIYSLNLLLIILSGCSKDDDIDKDEVDKEHPAIDISGANHFPKQCSSVKRGETFMFRATFTDNKELGTYALDIHHNFDHHNHSTEIEPCNLEPVKKPVKPFLFIAPYDIPAGLKTYHVEQPIAIPADIDPGDYHFMMRVSDKEGWSTTIGLSIKITE